MKPVLINIGPINIYSWGFLVSIAIIIGYFIARREATRNNIDSDKIMDLFFYIFILGIIGARIVYILFSLDYYFRNPLEVFNISGGGLAIHGAIIGGIFGGYIYSRKYKINFGLLADVIVPSLILGQTIGRIGCFLNGDSYGRLTTLPWGVVFEGVPGMRHPTQLYEAILNFGLFLMLWYIKDKKPFNGALFLIYLIGYSIIRIIVEIFRDSQIIFGPITYAQVASLLIIITAVYFLFAYRKKSNQTS